MVRILTFLGREGIVWPLILLGTAGWGFWKLSRTAVVWSIAAETLVLFLAAYLARVPVILRYRHAQRWLINLMLVIAIVGYVVQKFGHPFAAPYLIAGGLSFAFGCLFWAGSDEMLEMVEWLSFPTEFGRPPDEIHLIDRRIWTFTGEDGPELCSLYRYRYDQDWDVGLTGPFTFSLMGEELDGKPLEEIYAAYGAWNAQPDMPKHPK